MLFLFFAAYFISLAKVNGTKTDNPFNIHNESHINYMLSLSGQINSSLVTYHNIYVNSNTVFTITNEQWKSGNAFITTNGSIYLEEDFVVDIRQIDFSLLYVDLDHTILYGKLIHLFNKLPEQPLANIYVVHNVNSITTGYWRSDGYIIVGNDEGEYTNSFAKSFGNRISIFQFYMFLFIII